MYREELNFKSIIFKVLFIYLVVYFLALIFRYNNDIESLLNNVHYKYLIFLNIISISLGLPLTIIFDFILIKFFGLYYILFFSPVLAFLGFFQVLILRKIKYKFSRSILFLKNPKKTYFYKFFEKVNFKSSYILILRTFPILPFFIGSYYISRYKSEKLTLYQNLKAVCLSL